MAKIERFFNKATRELDFVSGVVGRVGSAPLPPVTKRFKVSDSRIGELPIRIDGQVAGSVQIYDLDGGLPIFDFDTSETATSPVNGPTEPEQAVPREGHAFTELVLAIGAKASAATSVPLGEALSLAAAASASGELRYRLLAEAKGTQLKTRAIESLLRSARPPQIIDLTAIPEGVLHTLDGRFKLSFGIEATAGREFDVSEVYEIFDDLSLAIRAHARATLSASIGWSLYERLQIAVGRLNVDSDPDWVRVRMERLRRSELTLGAKLAIQVDYNLGRETFEALLDRILELEPVERLFGLLEQIEELGIHEIESEAEWEALRDRLSAELADVVIDYVEPGLLIDQLPWDEVELFIADVAELVARYRQLDDKVRSFVESVLGRLDLDSGSDLRQALAKVAALDPTDLDEVLREIAGEEFEDAVEILELLGGASLEELLLDSRLAALIERAAALATQIEDFLDSLDDRAIERLEAFRRNSGIEGLVVWLEENATSTQKLRNALADRASEAIRSLVSRLVGKAWDQLDNDDLRRLKTWADALARLVDRKEAIEAEIRRAIQHLEGQADLSLAIEVGRLTERAAVLDLEIDPDRRKVREAVEAGLARLSAKAILAGLPDLDEPGDDGDSDEEVGYRLRDSLFSYRRVRSSSLGAVFSLLGLERTRETVRVDESVVRVVREDGTARRQAVYSTGTIRRLKAVGGSAYAGRHELATWLTSHLEGGGTDLGAPYEDDARQELRLAYSRADDKTRSSEIEALKVLLADLGFERLGSDPLAGLDEDELVTEVSLAITFRGDGAKRLLANASETDWNRDSLNAAHRWLDEPLVPRKAKGVPGGPRPLTGKLLAGVLELQTFREHWTKGLRFYDVVGSQPLNVTLGDHTYRVVLVVGNGQGRYTQLTKVLGSRARSADKLEQTVEAHKAAARDGRPEQWALLGRRFATLLARTPFGGGWRSPLYNLWLIQARLRDDPAALAAARGVATLRFREDPDGDGWDDTVRWHLEGANAGDNIFPF